MSEDVALRAAHVSKSFRAQSRAVDDVSLTLSRGEILGLVGESGCGKSTFARILVGLERADAGSLVIAGREIFADGATGAPAAQRGVQMVFQDPYGSLNPRMRARDILAEGLRIRGGSTRREIETRVLDYLRLVGLEPDAAEKYPHQFSGGQRQRLCIARALITQPQILLADEAASALDVSVQMQILNLLLDLRATVGVTILFISHDMGVIEYLCDRVAVMYRGRIVELGATADVLDHPRHPYTHRLIAARPRIGVSRSSRASRDADLQEEGAAIETACAYVARCSRASQMCRDKRPELTPEDAHSFACFHPI